MLQSQSSMFLQYGIAINNILNGNSESSEVGEEKKNYLPWCVWIHDKLKSPLRVHSYLPVKYKQKHNCPSEDWWEVRTIYKTQLLIIAYSSTFLLLIPQKEFIWTLWWWTSKDSKNLNKVVFYKTMSEFTFTGNNTISYCLPPWGLHITSPKIHKFKSFWSLLF